jgi:GMP synthase (glutamine-hydrolysing)
MTATVHPDTVLIVDFGSQVTQLIARRVRETGVYCEIGPSSPPRPRLPRLAPKAIILSGGPASTLEGGSPRAPQRCFDAACRSWASATASRPCALQLGGKVEAATPRVRPRRSRVDKRMRAV